MLKTVIGAASNRDESGRFTKSGNLFFAGYFFSAVGSGMVYPYMAVYVQQVRGLGASGAASALAIVAVVMIAGSLAAGFSIDRSGPRLVGAAGLLIQSLGYILIGSAATRGPVYTACAMIGLGGGAFQTALSPSVNAIFPPDQLKRAFAVRYMILNLGMGIGAVIAAVFLTVPSASTFRLLYDLNGVSFAMLLVFFWISLPGADRSARNSKARVGRPKFAMPRWRDMRGHRQFVLLLFVQTMLVAAGFSQMQSVVPLYLRVHVGLSTTVIGVILIVNCLGIVIIQPLVLRFGARVAENRLLALVGGIWAIAFAVGLGSSIRGLVGTGAILAFCGLFTLGESFYGPSFQPLLVRIAPKDKLGQYNGISWSLWGATTFVAPPLGVLLVDSRWPYVLWIICCAGGFVAWVCSLRISPSGKSAAVTEVV